MMMDASDYELDKTILCRTIGKAISDFVSKTGTETFTISAICDVPDVTYSSDGLPHHGANIRVYLDLNEEEIDDEE